MTHDEIRTRIKPILVDHVKAAHAAVDVAINAVRLNDRERIAELERDLAHARAASKKRDEVLLWIAEQLRSGTAPMSDVWWMSSGCTVLDAIGQVITVAGLAEGTPQAEKPPVVEEQGPWVIYDEGPTHEGLKFCGREGWCDTVPLPFSKRSTAQDIIEDFGSGNEKMRVITLAEARRIAGAK